MAKKVRVRKVKMMTTMMKKEKKLQRRKVVIHSAQLTHLAPMFIPQINI